MKQFVPATATIGMQVYQQLLDEIYSGALLPGQPIREKREGVSQGTVRQALIQLEHLGLVVRVPNRETTVANLNQADIANLIEVRIPLETLACIRARPRLASPVTMSEAHARVRLIGQSPRAEEEFHHFIWDLAANPLLARTLKDLSAPMFAFIAVIRRMGFQRVDESIRSRERFVEALLSDDITLQRAVDDHIHETYASFQASNIPDMRSLALGSVRKEAFEKAGGH